MADVSYDQLDIEIRKVLEDHPGSTCSSICTELGELDLSVSNQRVQARLTSLMIFGYVRREPSTTVPHCYVYYTEATA